MKESHEIKAIEKMSSAPPELLYHYCPTSSFLSILTSKSIRLSALSQSNDYLEGKLVSATLKRLFSKDKINLEITNKLLNSFAFLEQVIDGFAFCLSEKEDLLSQWRGYADDGKGVSFGIKSKLFSSSTLPPSLKLERVAYSEADQNMRVMPYYEKVKEEINEGAFQSLRFKTLLGMQSDEEIESENKRISKKQTLR